MISLVSTVEIVNQPYLPFPDVLEVIFIIPIDGMKDVVWSLTTGNNLLLATGVEEFGVGLPQYTNVVLDVVNRACGWVCACACVRCSSSRSCYLASSASRCGILFQCSVKFVSLTDFAFPQSFKVFHGKILSRLVELLEDRETGWSKIYILVIRVPRSRWVETGVAGSFDKTMRPSSCVDWISDWIQFIWFIFTYDIWWCYRMRRVQQFSRRLSIFTGFREMEKPVVAGYDLDVIRVEMMTPKIVVKWPLSSVLGVFIGF